MQAHARGRCGAIAWQQDLQLHGASCDDGSSLPRSKSACSRFEEARARAFGNRMTIIAPALSAGDAAPGGSTRSIAEPDRALSCRGGELSGVSTPAQGRLRPAGRSGRQLDPPRGPGQALSRYPRDERPLRVGILVRASTLGDRELPTAIAPMPSVVCMGSARIRARATHIASRRACSPWARAGPSRCAHPGTISTSLSSRAHARSARR